MAYAEGRETTEQPRRRRFTGGRSVRNDRSARGGRRAVPGTDIFQEPR